MKFILSSRFFFGVIGLLILSACTKVEKGPKGDAGPAGKNTKVASSQHQVLASSWSNTGDTTIWRASVDVTSITQEIISNGSVQVFVLKNNVWQALPYMEADTYTKFGYEAGKIHLSCADSHGLLPDKPGSDTYKVVTLANP